MLRLGFLRAGKSLGEAGGRPSRNWTLAQAGGIASVIDDGTCPMPPPAMPLSSYLEKPERNPFLDFVPVRPALTNWRLRRALLDGRTMALAVGGTRVDETCYLNTPDMLDETPGDPSRARQGVAAAPVVVGCNVVPGNYYHWMTQALPAIDSVLQRHGRGALLALPETRPWQEDSLARLGYAAVPRLLIEPSYDYTLPHTLYSTFLSGNAAFSVSPVIAAAYRRLRGKTPATGTPTLRIYVSRTDTSQRRMYGEHALIERLSRRGFRIVVPSTLSFGEQVELFSGAQLIVGPHGAGLTNMLFAPSGALVYELVPAGYANPCFRALADNCGLHHWADAFDVDSKTPEPAFIRPWTVDVDFADNRIRQIEALLSAGAIPLP